MVVFPKQICKRFLPDAGESRSNKTFFLKTNMELELYVHRPVVGFPVGAEAFRWQVQRHIKEVRDFQIDLNSDIQAKVLEPFDYHLPFPAGPISRRVPEHSKAVIRMESNVSVQYILWEVSEGKRPDKSIKGFAVFVR